jgi:hypothetical protein
MRNGGQLKLAAKGQFHDLAGKEILVVEHGVIHAKRQSRSPMHVV